MLQAWTCTPARPDDDDDAKVCLGTHRYTPSYFHHFQPPAD